MHIKNHNALTKYKNIELFPIYSVDELEHIDLSTYDIVYSPHLPIQVDKYPNTKFLFGPHFSVFPEKDGISLIDKPNSKYLLPSKWTIDLWYKFDTCKDLKIEPLPFGVETDRFNEIKQITDRTEVFIYFKCRKQSELEKVKNRLEQIGIKYRIFDYNVRYSEEEYLFFLQNAKYGICIGRHESQGFALEEALSCNVPLLIWNVSSMNQEEGSCYDNYYGTTIPYWDKRCGEYFYHECEFYTKLDLFLSNLETYKPREYVMENLSMDVCENRLIEIIENF